MGAAAVGLGLAPARSSTSRSRGPWSTSARAVVAAGRRSRSAPSSTGSPSRPCSGSGSRPARVSVALLVAIFVSNLPEAIGSAVDMRAAGALLVMLVDSMIREAATKAGRVAGLATRLGFPVAAELSTATA